MKIEDFKVGDEVIIAKKPKFWSGAGGKNPLIDNLYPFKGYITCIKNTHYDCISVTINEYGFELIHFPMLIAF